MRGALRYQVNRATGPEIIHHLLQCGPAFVATLRRRVDLDDYAKKMLRHAVRFEAWSGSHLVGLVAAYCNDDVNHVSHITSVSVAEGFKGKGIGAELVRQCIEHAKATNMTQITLEVASENASAIRLYERGGFVAIDASAPLVKMALRLNDGGGDERNA